MATKFDKPDVSRMRLASRRLGDTMHSCLLPGRQGEHEREVMKMKRNDDYIACPLLEIKDQYSIVYNQNQHRENRLQNGLAMPMAENIMG